MVFRVGLIFYVKQLILLKKILTCKTTVLGEPQLGNRGLYQTLSTKESGKEVRTMVNMLSYCDGNKSLLEIAELIDEPFWELTLIADQLIENDLLQKLEKKRE